MNVHLQNTLIGMGSIMSIFPTANTIQIPLPYFNQSDAERLASDWQKVGDDIRFAMRQVDSEQKQKKKLSPLQKKAPPSKLLSSHQSISASAGPIPSAGEMEGYKRINPELPLRIMAMAEEESAHRHQSESKVLEANIKFQENGNYEGNYERKRGQYFGFILGFSALTCSFGAGLYW